MTIGGLLLLLAASPALACVTLDHGDPRVGSVLDHAPEQVALYFNGTIFPNKSTVKVVNDHGVDQAGGPPHYLPGTDSALGIPVKQLRPGKYKIIWDVLCDCGSMNPGDYPFTVR